MLVHSALASQCQDFWVSQCQLVPGDVINQIPLPSSDDAIIICQYLCTAEFDCAYWQWSGPEMTCSLLTSSYLPLCHKISSTASPGISTCLSQDSGTCTDFLDENCEMSGKVLFETDTVIDAILGPLYGAEVFFFSDLEGVCYLMDSADRACVSMSGPAEPSVEKCEEDSTTTTTKATTTTDYVFFQTRLRSQLNPKSRLFKHFPTLLLASQIGLNFNIICVLFIYEAAQIVCFITYFKCRFSLLYSHLCHKEHSQSIS